MREEWTDAEMEILERIRRLGDEMHSEDLHEAARQRSRAEFERLVDLVLEKHPATVDAADPPDRERLLKSG